MNTATKHEISKAFFTQGAKLVNAHGLLAPTNELKKIVPDNTVIYFLADTSFCININETLGIQNKYFTSLKKLYNFMYRNGAKNNIAHVSNASTRLKLPGQEYLNMNVYITPEKEYPTMGYIKTLPTKKSDQFLTFNNIVPIAAGKYRLSELLKNRFSKGGVFIISACRAIPNNKINRFRHPGHKSQQPRGIYSKYILGEQLRKPRKGHVMKNPIKLEPNIERIIKRRHYPPRILSQLRRRVLKGENVLNVLKNLKAPANILVRKPGELAFLHRQKRLQALPAAKTYRTRSGLLRK